MLLPIRSKNPPESFPFVTCGLIALNVVIFLFTMDGLEVRESVVERFGLSFAHLSFDRWLASLFLHGDILHLLGNMWFLYLFGFAVEGRMRSLKFAALYFISGLAGDVLHLGLFGPAHPEIPTIGASGAIMGCLGAAVFIFPYAKVNFIFGLGLIYWRVVSWRMMWVAAYYIGLDVLEAGLSSGAGGVANLAHVGGAVGGLLCALAFRTPRDTEFASDAKATLDDTKDLSVLTARELSDLHHANPSDPLIVLHWMARSSRDPRGISAECSEAFRSNANAILNREDPRAVANVVNQIGIAQSGWTSAQALRLALAVEQAGDPATAFRIYEALIQMKPADEDYQAAIFRGSLILENAYFNFDRAAQGYRFLEKEYPMGSFTDQARSRLAALQRTGRTS